MLGRRKLGLVNEEGWRGGLLEIKVEAKISPFTVQTTCILEDGKVGVRDWKREESAGRVVRKGNRSKELEKRGEGRNS